MWTISSTDVQQVKERIDRYRAELETRYANEKQALEAESAAIDTFERAAAEFAQRRSREDPPAAAPLTAATVAEPEGHGEPAVGAPDPDAASTLAAEFSPPPPGEPAVALTPAAEADPAGYGEATPFDILKPGSRWRLNRAARLLNPEGGSPPTSSSS